MLRIPTSLVLLVLSIVAAGAARDAQAQTMLRGALGLSSFTVVGGNQPGDRSAFFFPAAGLMVQRGIPAVRNVSVEIGLFYVGKGADSEGRVVVDGTPIEATTELRLAYLDVPLLLRADFPVRPGVSVGFVGGGSIEFLLDEGIEIITADGATTGPTTSSNFRGTSFAGQVGASFSLERYEIGLRYHRSLSDVADDEADPVFEGVRHSGVFLLLSYRL